MSIIQNTHALIVGINDYHDTRIENLSKVVQKDAKDIHDLLINPNYCSYNPDNVQILLNEETTKSRITEAFDKLAQNCDKDSTVFFYISSHGGRIKSGDYAGEYLLPVDTAVINSNEIVADSAISNIEFTELLRKIQVRKMVVVFDCCHSGGIGQPKDMNALIFKSGFSERYYDGLQKGIGRVILSSSKNDESSYILPGDANSLFTKHLLAGLQGGISSEDGLIRIFDVFEYLQPKVTCEHPNQHPIFKGELEENFPVALYLGGQKGIAPAKPEEEFRYDVYISYVESDADWVWDILVERLETAKLKVAVSDDVAVPGVARVVNIERGIKQSKRTIIVLSDSYLVDNMADFENVLGQTMGIEEGNYRLLPIKFSAIDESKIPMRLKMLTTLNLSHSRRAEREFERLIEALKGELPKIV
ncbi:caspase family protein [Candidatus Halobeggiatoa sp. HSG11]|nr:caspase family protein [Candidatus Halobeggiatoa sp. HSG11]